MRVLQFGRYDFDEEKGGVQFYAELLARHIGSDIQIDQLVSSMKPQTRVVKLGDRFKVAVASYGVFASVPLSPGIFHWAKKLYRHRKYDLIHLNFPDPLALIATLFLPKKVPIVVTWHSDIVRQKFLLKLYQPLVQFFMKRVDCVIVATPRHLESCTQLRELRMKNKTVVIPFGIEEEPFALKPGMQEKINQVRSRYPGKFILFSFGRHVYYKGFNYLVDAMKDLPWCQLILGGTGPLTEELKAQASSLKIKDRVEFIGQVPFQELPVYLRACDLFCFPSVDPSEAFGYAQIEAMVCGKAVVGCDLKNGVNFVNLDGETGIVVPPRDSEALAGAIEKLQMDHGLLEKLSRQAQTRALQEFTARKTGERTAELFRNLVSAGG